MKRKCWGFVLLLLVLLLSAASASASGWTKEGNHLLYYNEDNQPLKGTQTIDGEKYSFNSDGTLILTGNTLLYDTNRVFCVDKSGNCLSGWQSIADNKYYFGIDSYHNGFYLYYACTGEQYLIAEGETDYSYYFFDDNGVMKKNFFYIDDENHIYYFGSDGKRVIGWKTIEGSKYYFYNQAYVGLQNAPAEDGSGDALFYFNNQGRMQTNTWYSTDGSIYYFGADGKQVSGWQTINGSKYYFDYCAYVGIYNAPAEDGSGNAIFYFDDQGRMQTNTWYSEDGRKFYFGADGKQVSGWQEIGGISYYFGTSGSAYTDGTYEIYDGNDHHEYTFDKEGHLTAKDGQSVSSAQPEGSAAPTATPAPAANNIGNAKVSSIKDQVYTGKEIQPKLTVKLNGKKLKEGSDYTVKWKKNKDIGTAKVTIKGKGKYKGSKEVTFKIIPAAVNLTKLEAGKKKLTVEWEKGSKADGYEIEYSRNKDFSESEKIKVKGAGKTSKVIKKLKKGKNYYVRVRVYKKSGGKTYYSKWSKSMKKKVK